MGEHIDKDDVVDEAFGELVDEQMNGFYLVTTKENGKLVSVHHDIPERLKMGDVSVNSPTVKLYYHVQEYLNKVQDQDNDLVTIEDVFHTLLTVHENCEWEEQGAMYELKEDND